MGREQWTSRLTVEECRIHLSTVALCSAGAFRLPAGTSWTVSSTLSNGSSLGSLRLEIRADWRGPHLFVCRLVLASGGKLPTGNGQIIRLTTTRPHFGGQRFWFVCECRRRAGRLYLPPGEMVFRCRVCNDLTYASAQEHNTQRAKMRPWVEWLAREFERANE